jgi:hypothetical protein
MKTTYHIPTSHHRISPKRGDLVQSNIGSKRERTWMILSVRELEPETRMRLFRSAERHGGQHVYDFARFPAKRKTVTFEQLMAR